MALTQDSINKTLASKQGEIGYKIVEALHDAQKDVWWVGGCVRDMLEGHIPDDIDIGTDAEPDDIITIVKAAFSHATFDEQGKVFGNVIANVESHRFEITTFREDDQASDGRFPESVKFGTREEDAARRDITINAIYWNPISRELFDPYEGAHDLEEKLIRVIGDPLERIKHDALRLLRIVRFRALIDGQYHPDTYHAMHTLCKEITVLSGARRLSELEKILSGPRPQIALEDLWELDILEHMIPELYACKGVAQPKEYHKEGDVWNHMIRLVSSYEEDHGADVRLAGLFHDCGKAVTFKHTDRIRFDEHASISADLTKEVLDRLQCPAKRRDKIVWLIRHHMMMDAFFEMTDERKAHWYYHPWFIELLQLFWLDIAGTDPSDFQLYKKIEQDYQHFLDKNPLPPKPLLSGDEIMEILGIKPGEEVGKVMNALHAAQVKNEITTKKEAREFIEKMKI